MEYERWPEGNAPLTRLAEDEKLMRDVASDFVHAVLKPEDEAVKVDLQTN